MPFYKICWDTVHIVDVFANFSVLFVAQKSMIYTSSTESRTHQCDTKLIALCPIPFLIKYLVSVIVIDLPKKERKKEKERKKKRKERKRKK